MKNAVNYEWFRVRSLRSPWIFLLVAGAIEFASGLYWGMKTGVGQLDRFGSALGLAGPVSLLIAALGVCAFSLDYQHGTIVTTRLVARFPARIVAAKALVIGGLSALGGILMAGLAWIGVTLGGGPPTDVGTALLSAGGVVVLAVLSGLAGLALGGLFRNTAAAVGVLAAWTLVAETLLASLARVPVTVLPFAGTAALFRGAGTPGWVGPLSLVVLTTAALGAVTFTLAHRDL